MVTDYLLPGVDGFEVARCSQVNHSTPVMLLTGIPSAMRRAKGLHHVDKVLAKTIVPHRDVGELLAMKAYPLLLQASPALVLLLADYWSRLLLGRRSD